MIPTLKGTKAINDKLGNFKTSYPEADVEKHRRRGFNFGFSRLSGKPISDGIRDA